jgi:hypothetical protein
MTLEMGRLLRLHGFEHILRLDVEGRRGEVD